MIELGGFSPLSILKLMDLLGMALKIRKNFRGLGLTLTENEVKDIMKVIRSLENRGMLLKETT